MLFKKSGHKFVNCMVLVMFMLLLFLSCCIEEKETEQDYARVKTDLVTNINAEGATFNGAFLQPGKSEIIDHGFVFDSYSAMLTIDRNETISLGPSDGKGSFSATVNIGLEEGKTYYVSAFARSKDKIFYAESVSFVSKGNSSPKSVQIILE